MMEGQWKEVGMQFYSPSLRRKAGSGYIGSQGTIRDRWGSGTWKPQRKYNYSNNSIFSYADTPQMQILKLIIVLRSLSH